MMKTGITSIASFATMSHERRVMRQLRERTTSTLMQMENAMSEDGEQLNANMLRCVRAVLNSRGILPNTFGS